MSKELGKPFIFRTTRGLRDRLVRKSAQNVLDGRIGLGAGATYSVNHCATELVAEQLGIEWERHNVLEVTGNERVGLSFRFPVHIYDALKAKADQDEISINEELQRILDRATS